MPRTVTDHFSQVPTDGWVTVFAGMAVNLCLGILYAWSMWGAALVSETTLHAGDAIRDAQVIPVSRVTDSDRANPEVLIVKARPQNLGAEPLKVKFGEEQKEGYLLFHELVQRNVSLQAGDIITKAGEPMEGLNAGWKYLNNREAAMPFSLCVILFSLLMIPGGRIQDRISPKFGATLGGLLLAVGCILAGMLKSYTGLILGIGICGGIGMGIGYASSTPAALKWFGLKRRGLIVGLVVGGYGGAALYVGPLAAYLMEHYGISASLICLGLLFAAVVICAGQLLRNPPEGYQPPEASRWGWVENTASRRDWRPGDMVKTWQYYLLVILFALTTQSGLLVIAFASNILLEAEPGGYLAANSWVIVSFGGIMNVLGRIGTGIYSDGIGRLNTSGLNCAVAAVCLFALPYILSSKNGFLLFAALGIAYWQYGGGLTLMPSIAADFYGQKNLGVNYGLIFPGWGLGFFMAQLGGVIKDLTGSLNLAFYLSGGLLIAAVLVAKTIVRPIAGSELEDV